MPLAATGTLAGVATHAPGRSGTLTGIVENPSYPLRTLAGTVVHGRWHAYEGPCVQAGVAVRINDEWVSPAELAGPVEIHETLDSPVVRATFGLIGPRWSALATEQVWTLTPVELWWLTGPPGGVLPELRFTGYVRTCQQTDGGPAIRVECQDAVTARYGGFDLCHEVAPLEGLTRGEIVRDLCADAGLTHVTCPDGAVYQKGLFTDSKKLFEFLREFIAPEGWKMRVGRDGSELELWRPELLAPPIPPDDEWGLSRIEKLQIEPPRDVASRWIVRGLSAVTRDEAGFTTTSTVTRLYSRYAPVRAVKRQLTDGSVIDIASPDTASLRLVQEIHDDRTERGGKIVRHEVRERGWYNPRAAKLWSNFDNNSYEFLDALLDEAGEYVAEYEEYFHEIGRRVQTWDWNAKGENTSSTVKVWRYHNKLASTSRADVWPAVTASFRYVFTDGESYAWSRELYGLAETVTTTREHNATTGAVEREVEEVYGYSPRHAARDGTNNMPIRASGRGQLDLVASWRRLQEKTTDYLLGDDGNLLGNREEIRGWKSHPTPEGQYDWGDFRSNDWVEQWRPLSVKLVQYNVISEDQYEEVTYGPEGRQAKVLTGRVPSPGYRSSPWTELRQAPVEAVLEDATLEAWFGFRRRILQNDYVQTLEEARDLLAREKERELAWKLTVDRAEATAEVGQTIFVRHPEHGLAARAMVTEVQTRREPRTGEASATYRLEVPL